MKPHSRLYINRPPSASKRGFTLPELLIVIGVIIILVALAVPSAITAGRRLAIMRLDETAKQIYIAAQNNLTSVYAAGNLSGVRDTSAGAVKMTTLPEMINVKYDEEAIDPSYYKDRYYFIAQDTNDAQSSRNTGAASLVLPESSFGYIAENGYFVIEYDAVDGMVYSVFFADEPFDYNESYQIGNFGKYMKYINRLKDSRQSNRQIIGYYGSEKLSDIVVTDAADPKIELLNGDELALKITPEESTLYTVTVYSTLDPSISKTRKFETNLTGTMTSGDPVFIQNAAGNTPVYWVLDSLTDPDRKFGAQFDQFVPGENIRCVVEAVYNGEDRISSSLPGKSEVGGNSLFESRAANGFTATIKHARHLQNLSPEISDVDCLISSKNIVALFGKRISYTPISNIEQSIPIDWSDSYNFSFKPITNKNIRSYNGNGNAVYTLGINNVSDGNISYAGLFGSDTLSGITFVNINNE